MNSLDVASRAPHHEIHAKKRGRWGQSSCRIGQVPYPSCNLTSISAKVLFHYPTAIPHSDLPRPRSSNHDAVSPAQARAMCCSKHFERNMARAPTISRTSCPHSAAGYEVNLAAKTYVIAHDWNCSVNQYESTEAFATSSTSTMAMNLISSSSLLPHCIPSNPSSVIVEAHYKFTSTFQASTPIPPSPLFTTLSRNIPLRIVR